MWEIESFETKTTNDIVCDNFCKYIHFDKGDSKYQVQLTFHIMIMTFFQIIITIAKINLKV